MQRSKNIVFVAHCLLNVHSKVIGLANYPGTLTKIISTFINKNYGIVQLPCPELQYMGLKRWSMTKEQYNFNGYRSFCHKLAEDYIHQMYIYQQEGYNLCGLFGVDGSPTCGMNYSCAGYTGGCFTKETVFYEQKSLTQGIFIEEILGLLDMHNISIGLLGIDEETLEVVKHK